MKDIVSFLLCAAFGCCGFTHRRVIMALLEHEPMPPAPKWHFWCRNKRN